MEQLKKIIKGCVANKSKAQEQLFNLYSKKLFGISLLYTKDYVEAEDVLQESFVKIFKNVGQFKHKGSFEGWMRRIVVNTAIEKHRRQHHLYPVSEIEDYMEEVSYDDIASKISAKDLLNLVHDLSPKYRIVFILYAIEGYSHQEIAKQLNISEGTSKSNLSRARKILQTKVHEQFFSNEIKNDQAV